jgi:hypothetical protein
MFAPLVAKAKSTGPQPAKAVDQTHAPRPSLDDQATSSFVAPQPSRTGSATGAKTIGSNAPRAAGQGPARSWDFSRISLHPSGLAGQPQTSSLHWPPRLPIQAKLKVGAVDDPLEREADRVADQVMRMPAPEVATTPAPLQISRKCADCEDEQKLQKKEAVPAAPALSEAPPSVHAALRSPGQPLDAATRGYFEPRFGRDFSSVRVHTDAAAAQSAREVNAHAYTVGNTIAFDSGRFAPGSHEGRRLLAHELTHALQQSGTEGIRLGHAAQRLGHSSLEPSFPSSGMTLQRAPVKSPDIKPIPGLAPLEVVARDVAELVLKNYSAEGLSAGPVLTAVLDELSGKIYIGLNSGIPEKVTDVIGQAISAQQGRIDRAEVIVVRTDPVAKGGHSESNAVNEAVSAREALLHRTVTEADLRTFTLHNIWLRGADRKFTAAPRCEHCSRITRSISVTSSVFFAEGGVSGEIKQPPSGGWRAPRVGPGGATGSISGEITTDKPTTSTRPTTTTTPGGGGGATPPMVPAQTAPPSEQVPAPAPAPVAPQPQTQLSTGTKAAAGVLGVLTVASEIMGSVARVQDVERSYNARMEATVRFYNEFGGEPQSVMEDVDTGVQQPSGTKSDTGAVWGRWVAPRLERVNVQALLAALPGRLTTMQSLVEFLGTGRMLQVIDQRGAHYYLTGKGVGSVEITEVIERIRSNLMRGLDERSRAQMASKGGAGVYRIRSSDVTIYRYSEGVREPWRLRHIEVPIITTQEFSGANMWVREVGDKGDRVHVEPANAEAEGFAQNAWYIVPKTVGDVYDEVAGSGRTIKSRQPADGPLEGFIAAPLPPELGYTRYMKHPNPDWQEFTIAIGELRQFWIDRDDLEPVSADQVAAYAHGTPTAPPPSHFFRSEERRDLPGF